MYEGSVHPTTMSPNVSVGPILTDLILYSLIRACTVSLELHGI